jgi:hypothetical protein
MPLACVLAAGVSGVSSVVVGPAVSLQAVSKQANSE